MRCHGAGKPAGAQGSVAPAHERDSSWCERLLTDSQTTAKITLSRQRCQAVVFVVESGAFDPQDPVSISLSDFHKTTRRPTMLDVAALAGVALKTVSRVVNSEPGVSPELEARVRRAIDQLNYRRDANAATLRRLGRKTQTIGLVLEDVSNPFSSELHRAVEDAARERGVLVFDGSCDENPVRERELIVSFRDRRVDGIIVVPASHDHTYLYEERRAGTALVFVDRPASHLDADSVVCDNVGGATLAVSLLPGRGHRRIGFLGDLLTISTAKERLRGYEQALETAGIRVDHNLIRTELRDPDAAARAIDELLAPPESPTAFFTGQNLLTIGGVHALRQAGRAREIALVGFDDIPLADLLDPAISVVAQDPQALGRAAADQLFRRLDGDTRPAVHQITPVTLIARG